MRHLRRKPRLPSWPRVPQATGEEGKHPGLYGLQGLGAFDEIDPPLATEYEPQEVVEKLDRPFLEVIGFGLPAVISASVIAPNKIAVGIDGDASSNTTAGELATAPYGIAIARSLLRETLLPHGNTNPDFVFLTKAICVYAIRCRSLEEHPENEGAVKA
ncbi:hypothetical protein P691DRAFT_766443 [Macrolepiota fuliginosa MF-IS2]|uniref:Thiamine pyrophosphate enzyme TPP-binding domain-containing protein n=1 Tax=Macrolepiota fuliginosa MF-IS2 TaxID=1400762 RepID=A0A9P5WYP2_9AGAR|nr:hypothetical protein P691DRAFT_766443 [Macrolepiota fuliginosa MF-IS2]